MDRPYPNLVLTFLIEFEGAFLLVRRSEGERNFPNLWAFPGGKVEKSETVVDALRREIGEETCLEVTGEFILLDTYCFGNSTGLGFLVRAKSNRVVPHGFREWKWVGCREDLVPLERIPGIDNHLVAAIKALKQGCWQQLEDIQLSEPRYLNR
jgi:8-oxo-dGTP pyrophosphatase MutT (NUDIX family)